MWVTTLYMSGRRRSPSGRCCSIAKRGERHREGQESVSGAPHERIVVNQRQKPNAPSGPAGACLMSRKASIPKGRHCRTTERTTFYTDTRNLCRVSVRYNVRLQDSVTRLLLRPLPTLGVTAGQPPMRRTLSIDCNRLTRVAKSDGEGSKCDGPREFLAISSESESKHTKRQAL